MIQKSKIQPNMVLEPFKNQMVCTLALIYKYVILLKHWFPKVVYFNVYMFLDTAYLHYQYTATVAIRLKYLVKILRKKVLI